jgi:hypothetical protein
MSLALLLPAYALNNVKSIILLIVVFVIMLVIACATYRKNIK